MMVYCVKCGAKNPEEAETCTSCGVKLHMTRVKRRSKRMEDECFGLPKGGTIFGLFIGLVIILAGISLLFQEVYGIELPWWPFVVVCFGLLILVGAIYGLTRR